MIDKNLELMDSITSIEEQSNKIKKENQDLFSKYGDQIISIENSSRKNAEIEISNLQNEKNIIIYQDNYNELNDYLEKLKLQLDNLKSKENDLNLLKDSCEQRRNDNNDLIKRLKNTINSLNGVNESNSIKVKDNLQFDTDDNNLFSKDSQIKKLNDIILKITEDQKKISEINEKMKMQIDNKFDDKKDLLIKEKELGNELQKLIEENNELKEIIIEKESKIKELKENTEKIEESLKKGETNISNLNINIDEILKEEENDILNTETNENELDIEIKNALEENIKKNNEIDEITKQYEELIQNKDNQISKMQIQLGENPISSPQMVEGLEDIDLHNNLDFNNNNYDLNNNNINNNNYDLNNIYNDEHKINENLNDNIEEGHLNIEGLDSDHQSVNNNLNEENILEEHGNLDDNKYFKGTDDI